MSSQAINERTLMLVCVPILIVCALRLRVDSLAGHMDEYDYLFVGKTLLSGDHWPSHTYIFGWDLNWLLLGWADLNLGGLAGARFVAALLGLLSIVGMYAFVHALWNNKTTALIAALLLSLESAHLFSSTLATYDIISFTFFIWSLPALILACLSKYHKWVWTGVSAVLLIAAVLSKYTALIYLPAIAILALLSAPKQAAAGMVLIILALSAYVLTHFEQLQLLYEIQINSAHDKNATRTDIVLRSAKQLSVLLILVTSCVLYAFLHVRTVITQLCILILMGLPLFTYHLLGQNVISLQKHLLYSSLFLIPVVAWGLERFIGKTNNTGLRYLAVGAVVAAFGISNYQQLRTMKSSFPNVQAVIPFSLQIQAGESVLSEDPYLFRYLLHNKVDQSSINETTWLDNNRDDIYEHLDVQHAVWDRKFNYVFLNDQQHAVENVKLRKMLSQRGYQAALNQPYELQTMSGQTRTGTMSLHIRNNVALSEHNID